MFHSAQADWANSNKIEIIEYNYTITVFFGVCIAKKDTLNQFRKRLINEAYVFSQVLKNFERL